MDHLGDLSMFRSQIEFWMNLRKVNFFQKKDDLAIKKIDKSQFQNRAMWHL